MVYLKDGEVSASLYVGVDRPGLNLGQGWKGALTSRWHLEVPFCLSFPFKGGKKRKKIFNIFTCMYITCCIIYII